MNLPPYESVHLNRSPLVLVAGQVNFEEVARDIRHDQARSFQKKMGREWGQLQSAPLQTTTLGPGGATTEPNRQAYRLSTRDDVWSMVINPDRVTIETRAYPGWDNFRVHLVAIANAVREVFDPASETRLGLRYVDQVPLPDGRTSWDGLLRSALMGLLLDEVFGGSVIASDQRVLIDLDDGLRCVLRHGLIPDAESGGANTSYLLDFDVFRENRDYDPDDAVAGADALHQHMGQIFRATISEELFEWLRG